jgi:hypothetical protein
MPHQNAIGFYGSSGLAYEPETTALLARMLVLPPVSVRNLINVTIKGLKTDGVFLTGDCLYVRAMHTSQAATLNWIKNAHDGTTVNAPGFQLYGGFIYAATKYVDNNYIPSIDGAQLQLASATIMLFERFRIPLALVWGMGAQTSVPSTSVLAIRFTGTFTAERGHVNSTPVSYNALIDIRSDQMMAYTRIGANVQGYVNGLPVGINFPSTLAAFRPSFSVVEGGLNLDGVVTSYDTELNSFMYIGAALNAVQHFALYTRMRYFFDNLLNCLNYGGNLIFNGGFDDASNWVVNANVTISGGKANFDDIASGTMTQAVINGNIIAGNYYRVTFTVSDLVYGSGYAYIGIQTGAGAWLWQEYTTYMFLDNGKFDFILRAIVNVTAIRVFFHSLSASSFKIDDLSIRELLP